MHEYLFKYLVLHQSLTLPQLGVLRMHTEPASMDTGHEKIIAPLQLISFEEGANPGADRFFFDFLTEEAGLDDVSAIQAFNSFCADLSTRIAEKGQAVLKGLGRFEKNENGQIAFVQDTAVNELQPSLPAGLLITAGTEPAEENQLKDYWWFYALILLILGLGALAYYYI